MLLLGFVEFSQLYEALVVVEHAVTQNGLAVRLALVLAVHPLELAVQRVAEVASRSHLLYVVADSF